MKIVLLVCARVRVCMCACVKADEPQYTCKSVGRDGGGGCRAAGREGPGLGIDAVIGS